MPPVRWHSPRLSTAGAGHGAPRQKNCSLLMSRLILLSQPFQVVALFHRGNCAVNLNG